MARRPINRDFLKLLADGPPGMDTSGIVTVAELDEWDAKLKAAKGHHAKFRIVMEQFIPFFTEKLNAAIRQKIQYLDAIAPPQN
jgi:hypothetical protein